MLTVQYANLRHLDGIMKFIDEHWSAGHILSKDKKLFCYEYQCLNNINFVLALDEKENIYGVLGFIKSSNLTNDVWLALWKVIKHDSHPMLGIELLQFIKDSTEVNTISCIGINDKVLNIYKYLGYYTNFLSQFVLINNEISDYKILKSKPDYSKYDFIQDPRYTIKEINQHELTFDFNDVNHVPHKDKLYFIKRYFEHPIYTYKVYGVYKNEKQTSLIVTRKINVKDRSILRIMDYLGKDKDILYVSEYLYKLVLDNNYEYLDFMCFGFNEGYLNKACFKKIDFTSDELVAPNYFSPFIKKNIKVNFMCDKNIIKNLRICKADGDQDRPM